MSRDNWKESHGRVVEGFAEVCEAVGVQFDAPEAVAYAINAKISNAEYDKRAAETELSALRALLDSIIARDDRNGSLPEWYRHEIDAVYAKALSTAPSGDGVGECGETALELEFQRDIMADALRQIADATGTYVSIAIFAVNTAKQVLSASSAGDGVPGMVLVPKTPTNVMHIAALEAGLALMRESGVDGLSPFTNYPAPSKITSRIWDAMINAAGQGAPDGSTASTAGEPKP